MRRITNLFGAALVAALSGEAGAQSAELPMPCVAGVCGASIPGFVSSGRATATATGSVLRVQQQTDRAILNWSSFNVGADGRVVFEQPNSSSIALNRIFQGSPSRILGAIEANGQIYLVNQNGFLFGPTARIRTSGLLVSSLTMADDVFENGLLSPDLVRNKTPALGDDNTRLNVLDSQGREVLGDDGQPLKVQIKLEAGASISTSGSGGRVMLASPHIDNAGKIATPDGQVLIAAGEKVYLQASKDPALRGLLVEVDAGGEAWNRMTGDISAARGNVTIMGLAVNQHGRVSATSTVNANGSIRLLARDTVTLVTDAANVQSFVSTNGGRLEMGGTSATAVLPESGDEATAVDEQKQVASSIELQARQVHLRSGSQVLAPGGDIQISAIADPSNVLFRDPTAHVRVESGARVDASGSTATASVSRNVVRVELRGNELRDAPLQRDGALRGKEVFVDARVGTPLADVTGAVAGIARTVDERTATGGTISVSSVGDIAVAPGAVFDVSGGRVNYEAGTVQTTQLLTADGRAIDISQANPNQQYIGLINPSSQVRYDRWGVVEQVQGPLIGRYEAGYVEGKSAGTLSFDAPALALNGKFLGNTVSGLYQRDAAHAPLGGRLIVGAPDGGGASIPDFRAPSINLVDEGVPISVGDDGILPRRPLDLPVDFLRVGGFTRAELYSNGVVHIPESMMLVLAPGSSMRITAHRVAAQGSIVAAGGSLNFAAVETAGIDGSVLPRTGIALGDHSSFDVRGLWNNELSLLTPVYRDGGQIDFAVRAFEGELTVGDGVKLLADGGASMSASGAVSGGRGGRIALRAGARGGALELGENTELSAFGVAGARGGSLTFEAPRIEIVDDDQWADAQRLDLFAGDTGYITLGNDLFANHGFASFDIAATGPRVAATDDQEAIADVLVVRSGTHLDAMTQTLELFGNLPARESGGTVAGFSRTSLQPDYLRVANSLTLRADPRDFNDPGLVGGLTLESGSSISVDTRGAVNLSSLGAMNLGGEIHASAGSITATIASPATAFDAGYLADLGITVGPDAWLDVAGVSLLRPNDAGLRSGDVLAGGRVNLIAERGFVDVERGARVDISGTASTLDLPSAVSGSGYQRRTIASAGGALTLFAPESLSFAGDLDAHAGFGDTPVAAGSATFQLTRAKGAFPGEFPDSPRTLLVVPNGDNLTAGRNGIGIIDTAILRAAGIDSLSLEAGGRIEFYSGADLSLARSLQVAAPLIGVSGDQVRLDAPYVSFGTTQAASATPSTPGAAQLLVSGDLIEFIGNTTLTGIANARFDARRELRLRGAENNGVSTGTLSIAGDLTLRAPIIYPTTLTKFSITAAGGANDAVHFESPGTSTATPLAVGGELNVQARSITQGTRLVAPFGAIRLNATDVLTLQDDSVTSVSAEGSLLLFGQFQLGNQWNYSLGGKIVEDLDLDSRTVDLSGGEVSIAQSATVDLSGGGDLYAYEWLPGNGGSRDALKPGETPGLYAILPSLRDGFAPYDPLEFAGSDLKPGDSIYLSGAPGLEAGFYPLLPARYALLPGAMLVSAIPGTVDAQPGTLTQLADGTSVVAGHRTFADTGLRDARFGGFALRAGSYGRRLAGYGDAYASTFDPETRPTAPADAGNLSLSASRVFELNGRVLTSAATGGRGASIDISAQNLLVTRGSSPGIAGTVSVDADRLQGWRAASLLLGGRRDGNGELIDVTADTVTLSEGTRLAGTELIATARNEVRLEEGSSFESLNASAATAPDLLFPDEAPLRFAADSAGSAIVAVSDNRALLIDRSAGAGTGGGIALDAGARVATRGALLLDAPQRVVLEGTLDGRGAAWSLGSSTMTFGGAPQDQGLTVGSALQTNFQQARRLRLAATGSFDFAETFALGSRNGDAFTLNELIMEAGIWRPLADGVSGTFTARNLSLLGATALPATEALAETESAGATLSLNARDLSVGPGFVNVDGFADLSFAADREIVGVGTASLSTSGNVQLSAANIGTASDADLSITALGGLRTARSGIAMTDASRRSGELGGNIRLSAATISHGGAIQIASGRVELDANDALDLLSGSLLDMSGTQVTAAGRTLGSQGGTVVLNSRGALTGAADSQVRVSGAGTADAGTVTITATGDADLATRFLAAALAPARGGSFDLRAGTLSNFATLNSVLEAGGFSERRAVRVGSGDLTLAAGQSITARQVELTTDDGSLSIAGTINASSDAQRGEILLSGGAGLTLNPTARLIAEGRGSLGRGGSVTLASSAGSVNLTSGSAIALGGENESGQLTIRASSTADGMMLDALDATISGVDSITLQPVLQFTLAANPNAARFTQIRNAVTAYSNVAAPALRERFAGKPVVVRPGIDMTAAGDLVVGTLELNTWRFDGQAADLAFHAPGTIRVNGTISDGFVRLGTTGLDQRLDLMSEASSSLFFDAGADLVLGANARIRSGTGDVSLRAGQDLVFGRGASVYTGGLAAEDTHVYTRGASMALPTGGGQLSLVAGRDVVGAPVQQAVGDWQVRQGRPTFNPSSQPGWGTDIQRFAWNAGTLGGGDVSVRAGGDIRDLSVAAADSASRADGNLTVFGGGVVEMQAGRDIDSAFVHVTNGNNLVRAAGEIGRSRDIGEEELLGSLFSMQNANLDLVARRGIAIESVFNPTVLRQTLDVTAFRSYFFTYGPESSLNALTATGNVEYSFDPNRLTSYGGTLLNTNEPILLSLLPPNVRLQALDGDVRFDGPLTIFPSDSSQLELFARRDIFSTDKNQVVMSDASAVALPTAANPGEAVDFLAVLGNSAASGRHASDDSPVLINAGRDIADVQLQLSKFARISAGRDMRTVAITGQNVRDSDATIINAGRDILYPEAFGYISLGGPGRLDVIAARDVDLGFSSGITTVGRTLNPALSTDAGADITVIAGLAKLLDLTEFLAKIVAPSTENKTALIDFVSTQLANAQGEFESALTQFRELAADVQRSFAIDVFFRELVASGREANNVPGAGFKRGYAAIDALFPGSRVTDSSAATYDGDLRLAFSRIYSLADADISLLVPGGLVNVGLAVPPTGVNPRAPSELGIVAQRAGSVRIFSNDDVLVNASRVFTLRGGDIAIWSTIGDIDAGRGAKSAISAPPPTILVDPSGLVTLDFAGAVAGSGIRAILTADDIEAGDVDLIAPSGIVDAGDAGIGSAGNLNVAAQQVVGLDNIQVGGTSTGVPAETSSLGAALSGASAVASSATSAASDATTGVGANQSAAPLADSAFGFLDVFLEGFGSEVCKPDDTECLKRNHK